MSGGASGPGEIPVEVLAAYGFEGAAPERVEGGLINATFLVRAESGRPVFALQRLHPVFAGEINLDIEAVTSHLAARGLETPRLVRTRAGAAWLEEGGSVWRALTWVAGTTFARVEQPADADAAGELVGRFHRALADLDHEFAFARAGVHDTEAHLSRLRDAAAAAAAASGGEDPLAADARDLAGEILAEAAALPPLAADLPRRICHGDLKISNVLFAADGPRRAVCLIDLDTIGRQTIAYELGDALRSWCNPAGEDVRAAAIDRDIFAAALDGYARGADGMLSGREWDSILPGLETVTLELAARFCRDVFEDGYFGWDPTRFASRREHNLVRAHGQLALARSVRAARPVLAGLAPAT